MDKLAKQLRADAERIDARISDELDRRIEASLRGIVPEPERPGPRTPARPALFWWASSVTGLVGAVAAIAIINFTAEPGPAVATPDSSIAAVPVVDWQAETATLTQPLQQELENLRSDLKKAEEKVREDIGL